MSQGSYWWSDLGIYSPQPSLHRYIALAHCCIVSGGDSHVSLTHIDRCWPILKWSLNAAFKYDRDEAHLLYSIRIRHFFDKCLFNCID
jgi:hypothetical protein